MSYVYNSYFAQIKLHTASVTTTTSPNIENVSSLTGLTGYTTTTLNCRVIYAQPEFEVTTYLDGYQQITAKLIFQPETMPSKFTDETNFESYFLTSYFTKPYKWIELLSYELMPTGLTSGKAIKVTFEGDYSVIENDDGTKQLGVKFYASI
jgi:hypothetical protein